MAKSLAPDLRRFYREIGLCVNCTLSGTGLYLPNPSSACSKAPICQICNSKGVHNLDCPSLHEHEHDAKVWTHDPSNIPSFDTRFFDQLLCTVYDNEGYRGGNRQIQHIVDTWTQAVDKTCIQRTRTSKTSFGDVELIINAPVDADSYCGLRIQRPFNTTSHHNTPRLDSQVVTPQRDKRPSELDRNRQKQAVRTTKVLAANETEQISDWKHNENLTAHLLQCPISLFHDPTRQRIFRDIGFCITCIFSGNHPSQCPAAISCPVCKSIAIHDPNCRTLRQRSQKSIVWKHRSDYPEAFRSTDLLAVVEALYSVDPIQCQNLVIRNIASSWTRNDSAIPAFLDNDHLADEIAEDDLVEIEIPSFDHLQVRGARATPLSRISAKWAPVNFNPSLKDLEPDGQFIEYMRDAKIDQEASLDEFKVAVEVDTAASMFSGLDGLTLPSSATDVPFVCLDLEMPNFSNCLGALLESIMENRISFIGLSNYTDMIAQWGGKNAVIHVVLRCIEPTLLGRTGEKITPDMLENIRSVQTTVDKIQDLNTWPSLSGYLDYITDSRMKEYMRSYVGQTEAPPIRISSHIRMMKLGVENTLHYFIFNKGREFRSWNFIRLWSIRDEILRDSEHNKERAVFLQNLLETLFCRVFQSLPGSVLQNYFGPGPLPDGAYTNLGLNVLPPLYQGSHEAANISVRTKFRNLWEESPDLEIKSWPLIRTAQLHHEGKIPDCSPADHKTSLSNLLAAYSPVQELSYVSNEPPISTREFDIHEEIDNFNGLVGPKNSLVRPVGNQDALLGVMYDPSAMRQSGKQYQQFQMPWGLEKAGLGDENSLVWAPTFSSNSGDNSIDLKFDAPNRQDAEYLNRQLLAASGFRVVIVCGKRMEKFLQDLGLGTLSSAQTLHLRNFAVPTYLQLSSSEVVRMFLVGPSPWSTRRSSDAKRFREILKFAATIINATGFDFSFYESSCALTQIVEEYLAEKNYGISKITINSLSPYHLDWLRSHGIESDDSIRELAECAGSIVAGMVMLINIKRQLSPQPNFEIGRPDEEQFASYVEELAVKPTSRSFTIRSSFDKAAFKATKEFYIKQQGMQIGKESSNRINSAHQNKVAIEVIRQRKRHALFDSEKGFSIFMNPELLDSKGNLKRQIYCWGTKFTIPGGMNLNYSKGFKARATYDKKGPWVPRQERYALAAKSGQAATFRLHIHGTDKNGEAVSFYAQNSGPTDSVAWVKTMIEIDQGNNTTRAVRGIVNQ